MARSDVQLMLDVKAGDEQSFALLLHRYRSPLINFLYRMVRNREQAEDLAQEVFIRVYRAREEYVPSAKFTTWLFRIATNLELDYGEISKILQCSESALKSLLFRAYEALRVELAPLVAQQARQ